MKMGYVYSIRVRGLYPAYPSPSKLRKPDLLIPLKKLTPS